MNTKFLYSTVGFEKVLDLIRHAENIRDPNPAYPPYNIIQLPEYKYIVELALSGWKREHLTVTLEGNRLTITGNPQNDPNKEEVYLAKYISSRSFSRMFTLADTIEVRDVVFQDGMLRIHFENVIPEAKKPRTLEIRSEVTKSEKPQQLLVEDAKDPYFNERGKEFVEKEIPSHYAKDAKGSGS